MKIKEILPLEVNFEIKNCWKYFSNKHLDPKKTSNRVFYLDAADYNNCGDLAIAEAIKFFIKQYFPDKELLIIRQAQILDYFKYLKGEINATDLIVLSGGGNMGTAYPRFEAVRRKIIRNFPDNRIVIFPCTVDYPNDRYGSSSLAHAIRTYSLHDNLLLYARENKTYDFFLKHFPHNIISKGPDIVFFMKCLTKDIARSGRRKDNVGICLRRDSESAISDKLVDGILNYLRNNNMHYNLFTTMCSAEDIDHGYAEIVKQKLQEVADYSLVITDRLHATIFSCLVGTPCIAFDNVNGKVFGVCKEIENRNVVFAEPDGDLQEYINRAVALKPSLEFSKFDEQFSRMSVEIRGTT